EEPPGGGLTRALSLPAPPMPADPGPGAPGRRERGEDASEPTPSAAQATPAAPAATAPPTATAPPGGAEGGMLAPCPASWSSTTSRRSCARCGSTCGYAD